MFIRDGAKRVDAETVIDNVSYKVTAYYVPNANIIRIDLKER